MCATISITSFISNVIVVFNYLNQKVKEMFDLQKKAIVCLYDF